MDRKTYQQINILAALCSVIGVTCILYSFVGIGAYADPDTGALVYSNETTWLTVLGILITGTGCFFAVHAMIATRSPGLMDRFKDFCLSVKIRRLKRAHEKTVDEISKYMTPPTGLKYDTPFKFYMDYLIRKGEFELYEIDVCENVRKMFYNNVVNERQEGSEEEND